MGSGGAVIDPFSGAVWRDLGEAWFGTDVVVWWIVVLAVGVSVLYQRSTRSLALAFTGAYVALALLAALAMAVSGGTA